MRLEGRVFGKSSRENDLESRGNGFPARGISGESRQNVSDGGERNEWMARCHQPIVCLHACSGEGKRDVRLRRRVAWATRMSPLRSGDILVADVKPPAKQHFPVVVELATEG